MYNLIFIRLAGGLGNQLFQVAAAQLLAQRNSRIVLITGGLRRYKSPRNFDLDRLLNLAALNMQVDDGENLLSVISERLRLGRLPLVGVNDRNIKKIELSRRWGINFMDGYFQDFWSSDSIYTAFSKLKKYIKSDIAAKDKNTCVVHIRGGDFLDSNVYNIIPMTWYVSQAREIVANHDVAAFCIISDDIKVANLLSADFSSTFNLPVLVKAGGSLLDDFNSLRTASYRLIGNSTFALSAAALACDSGITYAPNRFDKNRIRNWRLASEIITI